MKKEILFETNTPLGFRVRLTKAYWEIIINIKHPVMKGKEAYVKNTLINPNEIRKSRSDSNVLLFYLQTGPKRWICVVVKRLNSEGFIITTYPTDIIKEGEQIWKK